MTTHQNCSDEAARRWADARTYHECVVPAVLQPWGERILAMANLAPGERALDVACGTGVIAALAAEQVGVAGSVVGVDLSEPMLEIARTVTDRVEFINAPAERLPFADDSFDVVLCQFGLMFFDDRASAIREMRRVGRAGGRLYVSVWDSLAHAPGSAAVLGILAEVVSEEFAAPFHRPYCLGDAATVRTIFREAGVNEVTLHELSGLADFPSVERWLWSFTRGWRSAEHPISDDKYEAILARATAALGPYTGADGRVRPPFRALVVEAALDPSG